MRLAAQLDPQNVVIMVAVCSSLDWIAAILGGTWVDATPPDTEPDRPVGVGYTYDPNTGSFTPPPYEDPPDIELEPTP
jgi:hypothetical protein